MNRKEQKRLWYLNNSEKVKEYTKEYYLKNREKIREQARIYNTTEQGNKKNRERGRNYNATEEGKKKNEEWRKSPAGKKSTRIAKWKQYGVINDDFNSLYDYYLNCENCEKCNVELIDGEDCILNFD